MCLTAGRKKSKSLAKKGLREGLRDILTMLKEMTDEQKKELNELLIGKDLPGLYTLMSIIKNIPQKVLKAGKIKNLDEYYVVKEVIIDISSDLSTSERSKLEAIFSEYENNYGKTKNAS